MEENRQLQSTFFSQTNSIYVSLQGERALKTEQAYLYWSLWNNGQEVLIQLSVIIAFDDQDVEDQTLESSVSVRPASDRPWTGKPARTS